MRVISGKYRGRRINSIDSAALRPTTAVTREAIFNILTHNDFFHNGQNFLHDATILDLFCGCGALTIEALSRGAKKAILIDIDQKHLDICYQNIAHIGALDDVRLIRADSSSPPPTQTECNLVFLDPPYRKGLVAKTLTNLLQSTWLAPQTILVVETHRTESILFPHPLEPIEHRAYGNSQVYFLKYDLTLNRP